MRPMQIFVGALVAGLVAWGCGGESGESGGTSSDAAQMSDGVEADAEASDAEASDAGAGAGSDSSGGSGSTGGADGAASGGDDGGGTPDPVDAGGTPDPDDAGGTPDPTPEDVWAMDTWTEPDAAPDVAGPEDTAGGDVVSFATVFSEILKPMGCTAGYCHAGHAGGMLMDSLESAYQNLVNVEASTPTDCDATMRVVPGDPDASMLWIRVRAQEDDCLTADQKMPPFGDEGLSEEHLALIYDWILTGANP